MSYTTLSVREETGKRLRMLKIQRGKRSMDELLRELLREGDKNGNVF